MDAMKHTMWRQGRAAVRRVVGGRFGGVWLLALVYLVVAGGLRAALLAKAAGEVTWDASLVAAWSWGAAFDLGFIAWAALPLVGLLAALPANWGTRRWQRVATHATGIAIVYAMLFGAVAEWLFWDEFGVRFNFIAVDYLVYTKEVLGNIRESYHLGWIFGGVAAATAALASAVWRTGWPARWLAGATAPVGSRWRGAAGLAAAALMVGLGLSETRLPAFANNFNRELAKNGPWSLFAAFKGNVLDYEQFYRTLPTDEAFARLRHELAEDGSTLVQPGARDTLRYVSNPGPVLRPNVIQITVESLSAEFVSPFNRASKLTPNLQALAEQSLVFDQFYATGVRTDRGMEALTLSLPPTPGRSMIKRPRNENMFTLGSVFRGEGYDTAFIYGGYGYFDNMNHFFGENGYRVVDRASVARSDVTFANVWGACDEDLFRWAIREADAAHASGRPFHHFVMTTSNHRPFTYPEGKIDLPPKTSGRIGAVKYTDYAIGELMRVARTKPWFRNTVFVFVADHCASSAGKTELPVQNYRIPLLIYAPGGQIAPGHVTTLTSQMDYAPTLLGLLGWSYASRFFGHDVRRIAPEDAHALIGNYQKLGHIEHDTLVVLSPQRGRSAYRVALPGGAMAPTAVEAEAEGEAIGFYQGASYLYTHGLYRALTAAERTRVAAEAGARTERPGDGG